ncbi:uncharacterized protein LOC134824001 [Bolinopsis microptera]|uniref:uncharacterized protein LOC134824001 n=1 Tax=Bolinopsis microptera TaxID=2820187 RepID=UPI00307AE63E
MSEDIIPSELSRTSSNEEGGSSSAPSSIPSSEGTSLARSGAASVASYQSITSHVGTGPVRYVMSGIKPSLSYFETVGICLLTLTVPVLLNPVIGSKPTMSMDHLMVHSLSIALSCLIAAFIGGIFAELHHYHPVGCGGIVSVASTVCGGVLSYLAVAASLVAVIFQVSDTTIRLSDLIDRLFHFSFTDSTHDWSVKVSMLTLLLVVVIFLSSMAGILVISRIGAVTAILSFCFTFVFAGYGISHKVKINSELDLLASMNISIKDTPHSEMYMIKGVNDHESSVYIDNGLHSYIGYLTSTIEQLVVVNLLLPLTEDNKLKKPKINIIGACVFLSVVFASLFMNLALSHISSVAKVFVDQAGLTMGMPEELVTTISVVVGLAAVCRAVLILYSVARVMCHMVVRREMAGNTFRPCKIFKLPMFVNGIQCMIVAGTLFIRKEDVSQFAMVSLFIYICIGAACHILHRFATPESCESIPLIESMGSLKPLKAIKILLVMVICSSLALCIADIAGDFIILPTYTSKQIYAVVRIFLALLVIGSVSIIASFEQKHGIAGIYRWGVWTPMIPSAAILLACVTVIYNWYWGGIISAVTLLVTANIFAFDKVSGRFCCASAPQTADDVSQN